MYGNAPTYTPGYTGIAWVGGDSPAIVNGTLACSTSATASSSVTGNPYVISGCSGLSAANYAISYADGAFTVTPTTSATSLTSTANPAVTGQTVTYTVTVTSTHGSVNPNNEGTVTFTDGGSPLSGSPVALTGNVAACTLTYPGVGTQQIVAVYSGGPDFAVSTAEPLTETVVPATTLTTLTPSSPTILFGQHGTLTATVAAVAPGAGIPTGTVTFSEGTTVLGSSPLNGAGQAIFATNAFMPGPHAALTAAYSGDPNYRGSTSSATQVTIGFTNCVTGRQNGPLTVHAGEAVCITGTVAGSVTVQPGGALDINGGSVSGPVSMTQPTAALLCGASVSGPLSIQGATGPVLLDPQTRMCEEHRVGSDHAVPGHGRDSTEHHHIERGDGDRCRVGHHLR